jgi:Tfp pilus assembly protein PilE
MNIFRLLLELFVIYIVYKLVFEFIIPVYKTTKHMKQKMSEMQQKMQQQEREQASFNNKFAEPASDLNASKKAFKDDYIEYEEVK